MVAVVGAAVAVQLLPARYADAYYLDPGATTLVCTPDVPKVCVTRVRSAVLDDLRDPGREALAILSAKLPQAPTSVVEVIPMATPTGWTYPPGRPDQLYTDAVFGGLLDHHSGRIGVPPSDLVWNLLVGAGAPPCAHAFGPPT